MQALVELFYRCEESARQQEAHTNEIIDHDLTEQSKLKEDEKKEDEIEETVAKCRWILVFNDSLIIYVPYTLKWSNLDSLIRVLPYIRTNSES